jgi:TM2 domain-containing membrane protein YozV
MDGITILSQTEITTQVFRFNSLVFAILYAIALVACYLLFLLYGYTQIVKKHPVKGIISLILSLAAVIIFTIYAPAPLVGSGKYEYKVKISADVKLADFYKNYEIISVDKNDVYTIIEKTK